jgi:hypothetical protein
VFKSLLLFLAFATVALHAQSVRWEPGSGMLAINQLSELSLIFDQCEPEGTVTPPNVTGLGFGTPSRSENTSYTVVNFKASSTKTVTLTYRVRPSERRTLSIPAFTVNTDKGRLTVPAATFEVGETTVGNTGLSIDTIARSAFSLPDHEVWAGEVFPLTYSLNVFRRYFYQLGSDLDWNPAPLSIETWAKPELIEAVVNNEQRVSILYKTRAYAKTPGPITLKPASQLVNVTTGATSGFGLFSRQNLEQINVTSAPATLTVRALPSPAPASFTGAVGRLTLDSKVVPATASVGEPITWTLTLAGTANWPDIAGLPPRSVSKDFRVVQPQAKRVNKEGSLYDVTLTEDIVLIPTRPGTYTLAPVNLSIFNPTTGAYETLTTPPVSLNVTPSAITPPPSADKTSGPPAHSSQFSASGAPPASTPPAPAALPRDPLPPSGSSLRPFTTSTVLLAALSALLCPLIVWLTLALRRARLTDPVLPRRQARARLAATLTQIDAALYATTSPSQISELKLNLPPSTEQRGDSVTSLLLSWRRDTVILLRLPFSEPTTSHFSDPAWAALWTEADRSCYGTAPLPTDWTARARQALAATPVPPFSACQLFLSRNLLPLLAVAILFLGGRTSVSAADSSGERQRPDPSSAAYASADFPAAEKHERAALSADSTDWAAHHNLSLALTQQDRTGEAAGHALAAYVQRPQNPAVRAQLAYTWQAAAVTPPALKPFLTDAPLAALARLAAPTRWQLILIASAWLLALAAALTIRNRYHRSSLKLATLTAALAVLGLSASAVSLHTYGELADRHAVVVVTPGPLYSIPTELAAPQKTSALVLGNLATADKTFLGWTRLRFPDGQTGWTRTETLTPLW